MSLLQLDSRWRRFNDENRACPCCGQTFSGIFDIVFDHPDDWPHGVLDGRPGEFGQDRLGQDLCQFDNRFFIRCALFLPVRGSGENFGFGPWIEVSPATAESYSDISRNHVTAFSHAEGLLANTLPLFEDDDSAPVALVLSDPAQCPEVVIASGSLAKAQDNGISFDQLLDIYSACGQDIRPHLVSD